MTRRIFYIHVLILMIVILWSTATTWAQALTEITHANQLHNKNQFRESAEVYERVIESGAVNGHLYYNLANTYYRIGNLPKSILNYTKAQRLLPRNEDVEANLEHTIRQTVDQLDGRKPYTLGAILFWIHDFNLNEHRLALLWINLAFWITMIVWLRHPSPVTRSARNLLLAFLVLAIVSTGSRWYQETHHTTGVILPQKIDIHSGWNPTTKVLFQLHQGTVITISQEKDNWYEIELPDTQKGWTLKSNIAR